MENQNMTKDAKIKLLAQVNAKLKKLDEIQKVEEMIQDNSIEWKIDGVEYRVRKPGRRERQEVRTAKHKRKTQLVFEENVVSEEDLIKAYMTKETPIDIQKMRDEIKQIQQKIDDFAIPLIENPVESEKAKMEEEIDDLSYEQTKIMYDINDYLDCSLEQQLKEYVQEYLVFACLDRKTDNGWVRHYPTYEDFMNTDEKEDDLVYQATWYFAVLINREENA